MSTTHIRIGALASAALIVFLCFAQATSFRLTSVSSSATLVHHQQKREPATLGRALGASTTGADETTKNEGEDCACPEDDAPDILQPYLPAMDPQYSSKGPIGEGDFIISRSGGPTAEELSNEQMLKIVKIECTDLEVNTLVWKCLGYRFDEGAGDVGEWQPDEVFPKWKERFPTPPDFIGMQRVYSREVDQPSLRANQALVRSIPAENKQNIKAALTPLGWKGYKVSWCCALSTSTSVTSPIHVDLNCFRLSTKGSPQIRQDELNARIGWYSSGRNFLATHWMSFARGEGLREKQRQLRQPRKRVGNLLLRRCTS